MTPLNRVILGRAICRSVTLAPRSAAAAVTLALSDHASALAVRFKLTEVLEAALSRLWSIGSTELTESPAGSGQVPRT